MIQQYECKEKLSAGHSKGLTPSTSMSDQDRISPHNINTVTSRQVMRIYVEKNIN